MLSLRYNSHFLDLGKFSATIKMENPIFDRERTGRVYSFPFRIPMNPGNQGKLKNIHRIDSRSTDSQGRGQLYSENSLLSKGLIKLKEKSNTSIQLYYQNVEIDFLSQISKVKINTLLDSIDISALPGNTPYWEFQVLENSMNQGDTDEEYSITVRGRVFKYFSEIFEGADDISQALFEKIEGFFPGLCSRLTKNTGGPATYFLRFESSASPTMIKFGNDLTNNIVLTHEDPFPEVQRQKLSDFLDDLRNNPDERFCFPIHKNTKFYGKSKALTDQENLDQDKPEKEPNEAFEGFINPYDSAGYVLPHRDFQKQWKSTFVPFIKAKHVLEKVLEAVGMKGIKGDVLNIQEFAELAIYNIQSLDKVMYERTSTGSFYYNYFQTEIDLNKHVPEISGKEYLTAILDLLGLFFEIKGEYLYLQSIDTRLLQPAKNWTDKAQSKYKITVVEKNGLTLSFPRDTADSFVSNPPQQQDYEIGAGGTPLVNNWGTMDMVSDTINILGEVIIPRADQVGQSDEIESANGTALPRFIFFRGFHPSSSGNRYPLATTGITDQKNNIIGDLALQFEGPNGLFRKRLRGYVNLLEKDIATLELNLSSAEIENILNWKNSHRRIEFPEGIVDGIVTNISQKVSADKRSLATVQIRQLI